VYNNSDLHSLVRTQCVKYMRSEQRYFSDFIADDFQDYLAQMELDGVWGDQPEIQAASELYNRPVQVFAYSLTPLRTYNSTDSSAPPIRLSYHFNSHYNSLMCPATHAGQVLQSQPGQVEEERIAASKQRASVMRSDPNAKDGELQRALEASRRALVKGSVYDVDGALQASLNELYPSSATSPPVSDLDRALAESLGYSAGLVTSSEFKSASLPSMEDRQLAMAVEASMDVQGGPAVDDYLATHSAVLKAHHDFGFPLEACINAYKLVQDSAVTDTMLLQNLTNYLLSNGY